MENTLENYGRYLFLKAQLPKLEAEKENTRRLAMAADRERSQKKVEWECLKHPGFFQRLLGKVEEKRDAAYRAYQKAEGAWKNASHASQQAAQAYEEVKAEMEAQAGSEAQYEALPKTQEVRKLAMMAFRPAALYDLNRVISALEQALQWENQERDVGGRLPNQDDGMWEQLTAAKEPAKQLKYILEQFPEPENWLSDYLRNPDGFVYDGVIMKISPRNKIRIAIGQMEQLRIRLQ